MNEKDRIIAEKDRKIEELQRQVDALTSTVKELQDIIQELRRQLNQDSHNSSKPPSSDGFKKPRTKSLRKKSGKKQGGQKGHTGTHMAIPHEPDEVLTHLPEPCQNCPHLLECLSNGSVFRCAEKRYEVQAHITTSVIEHQAIQARACPCGNQGLRGQFPEQLRAYVQYGDSVAVLASLLNTFGAMSIDRVHIFLGSILDVHLSTGTVAGMIAKCAKVLAPTKEAIRELVIQSGLVNLDETGVGVNGKLYWVHSASTETLTYQTISEKRGQAGMEEGGILPYFSGIAVHDCWNPYWKYDGITHAVCNAHILRELTAIEEMSPTHTWATEMKRFLLSTKKVKEDWCAKGGQELAKPFLEKYVDGEYDEILELADSECPPPAPDKKKRGRPKKGKERSLIERLRTLKGSVCLFAHNFHIPFDNNQAERDVRNVKTKDKVSGCFRTKEGAQNYLDIMSYLSTAKKRGHNVFQALTAAFAGNTKLILE